MPGGTPEEKASTPYNHELSREKEEGYSGAPPLLSDGDVIARDMLERTVLHRYMGTG